MDALTNAKFLTATQARWGASQGWYYKAISPTPGTGIISAATAAFSATAALMICQNTAPAGSNVFAFLDYLKLIVTVADATSGASAFQYAIAIDNTLRYSSGGTQIVTPGTYANNYGPVNALRIGPPNIKNVGPQLAVFLGAVIATAESANVVRTAQGIIKTAAATPVGTVGDDYILNFGSGADAGAGSAKTGTTASVYRQNVGTHCIAPQSSLLLHFWFANASTGLTVEPDLAWFEAPTT